MSQVMFVCWMMFWYIYGATQTEHNTNLEAVLKRIVEAGVTLNREKCSFSQNSIKFLHHTIEPSEFKPDPDNMKS